MPTENQTAPRERPILLSAPMVRAILDGRKTVTRRVVKPQPTFDGPERLRSAEIDLQSQAVLLHCPYQPGDRLWVRETWAKTRVCQAGGEEWFVYRESDNRTDRPARKRMASCAGRSSGTACGLGESEGHRNHSRKDACHV